MDERPTKETIIDGETGTNDQRRPSLLLFPPPSSSPQLPPLLPSPMPSSPSQTMTQSSINPPAISSSPHKPQKVAFTAQNDLQPSRRSAPPLPSATSPFSSPSVPLDTLLFAKRPVPPLRQPTLPLPSQINMSRTSSFSSSVSSSLGFAGDDGVLLPSSPTDNFPSSPTSISPPPQPISLLSQILVTHSQKLSSLGGGGSAGGAGGALVSPLSSTPNSTASSPVGGASAQLHGIFRRRGSVGANEVLDKVGEEEMGIEEQLEGYNIAATTMVPRPSIFAGASPNLSPRTRSNASSPSKRFLPPPPPSPTRPSTGTRAPSRLMFSEPDRNSATSTPDLHSSPEATSSSFPSSPVAGVVELPLPTKRVGLVFVEDPEIVSRRSISTAPPSPTQPSLPPTAPLPQKKPSNLTFAVTSVCARPPAMGKTPGPDREMEEDDDEEDEEDDDLNGEVDLEDDEEEEEEDEDDGSLDEDGYLEDDEEDASSEEDEEGVSTSPAERRRYRYKRHALFGEDSTDEDEEDEEDGFGGEDDVDEDGSLRTRKSARDSVLSNFSFDKTVNDSPEAVSKMLAETSLRHRRSASLKRRSASLALLDPPPPVPPLPSTSTLPQPPSSSATSPKLLSARRTHFPTPLVLRQDHSAFPRSPVPKSIVRGGGGYSPRVRKGTRMAAGVQTQDPTRARLGRDDFLPTHLKSEEGKERERERERERDSTTDQGGGVSSGKCSRHRSPPPSSAGRDKMKAHGERRSRSVVAGGEGSRAASSSQTRRTSTDVGRVALPPPPSPILKRNPNSTNSAAPPSRVILTAGELTPVFLTDVEDSAPIARQPPSAFRPTLISPTTITTTSILQSTDILSPPPSRRESSSERRASLSAVCSVFQRSSFSTTSAHNSDDPSSSQLPTISRIRRPSIALDGSSSAPYTQRSAAGATFVDGSALTQSLQKALGGERSIRPFSPPPTAPSSFVPPRFPTANLPAASSSVPTRQIAKRRFSQPPIPTTATTMTTPVKSRPIACPARGGGGGWTDGG